jgi:hypothetical protein
MASYGRRRQSLHQQRFGGYVPRAEMHAFIPSDRHASAAMKLQLVLTMIRTQLGHLMAVAVTAPRGSWLCVCPSEAAEVFDAGGRSFDQVALTVDNAIVHDLQLLLCSFNQEKSLSI